MARNPSKTYDVGYRKPPVQSRFRKGQSGNPTGRTPGSKNLAMLLADALDQRVVVKEGAKRRAITKREAIVTQLVNKSAGADLRAIRMLLDLVRSFEGRIDLTDEKRGESLTLSEADDEIMAELRKRIKELVGGNKND